MINILDVIIPVYKAKDTLPALFDSLVAQTKKIFMVHVVQDCDGEDYTEIYKTYTSRGLHIDWIALDENKGPGGARQYALDHMCVGDYVTFIDADDLVTPRAIEVLYTTAKREDAVMVVSSQIVEKAHIGSIVMPAQQSITWLHGKCINRGFLETYQVRFMDNIRVNEDSGFNALIYLLRPKIMFIDEPTYIWRDKQSSLTRKNLLEYHQKGLTQYLINCCNACLKANALGTFKEENAIAYINALYHHYEAREAIEGDVWIEEPAYINAFFNMPIVQKTVQRYKNWEMIAKGTNTSMTIDKKVYFFTENVAQWVSHYTPIKGARP